MFQVISTIPSANAADVALDTSALRIQFSDEVDPATVSALGVTVGISGSQPFQMVDGTVGLSDADTVQFTPAAYLPESRTLLVIVTGGAFGIKSLNGRVLPVDYRFEFTTATAPEAPEDPEEPEEPAGDPEDGIPLDAVSALAPLSYTFSGGTIRLVYEDDLPEGTIVRVTSRHPLGYLTTDHWLENKNDAVISDNIITIDSSGTVPLTFDQTLFRRPTTGDLLFQDSIPIVDAVPDGDAIAVDYDFTVNREYTVSVTTPDDGTYQVSALPYLGPMFATLEEVKLYLNSLANAFTSDDEIRLHIYLESQQALQIWQSGGCQTLDRTTPYYMRQYVLIRMALSAFQVYTSRTTTSGAAEDFTLGDFKVSLKDPSDISSENINFDPDKLTELTYVLAARIKSCSFDTEPIWGPTYGLMAPNHQQGIIGLVPGIGRSDVTLRNEHNRSLNFYPPRGTRSNTHREID